MAVVLETISVAKNDSAIIRDISSPINEASNTFAPHIPELKILLKPSEAINQQRSIYEVNTSLWLGELSRKYGREITIGQVPEEDLAKVLALANPYVWFMGAYKRSPISEAICRNYLDEHPKGTTPENIWGSAYAIDSYDVLDPQVAGSWEEWDLAIDRIHEKGKKIMIDFVPNHGGKSAKLVKDHPEYFIQATAEQFKQNPSKFYEVVANDGQTYFLAYGASPGFDPWVDTTQFNYAREDVQEFMTNKLMELSDHADAARCDMAGLITPQSFMNMWGDYLSDAEKAYLKEHNFWESAIAKVKTKARSQGKEFIFVAEGYDDKSEYEGFFDSVYGTDVLDELLGAKESGSVAGVRSKLNELLSGIRKSAVLCIENHDLKRAATALGSQDAAFAAETIVALIPNSINLINQGQDEGREITLKVQTGWLPKEGEKTWVKKRYKNLSMITASDLFQNGQRKMATTVGSDQNVFAFQAIAHGGSGREAGVVVCVNFGYSPARFNLSELGKEYIVDVYNLSDGKIIEHPDDIRWNGLYMDIKGMQAQVVSYSQRVEKDAETHTVWQVA